MATESTSWIQRISRSIAATAPAWRQWILAIGLVVLAVAGASRNDERASAIDFYQFWVVGRALGQGQVTDIYSDRDRETLGQRFLSDAESYSVSERQIGAARFHRVLSTYSTPFLYSVFYFIDTGSYDRDLKSHQLLSLLFLLIGVACCCRAFGYSLLATSVALCFIVYFYEPYLSDSRVANVISCSSECWVSSSGS